MYRRTSLHFGLLNVVLAGFTASIFSNQSSYGAEWRRPTTAPAEDPAVLLQRAEELIERATRATEAERRKPPAAAPAEEDEAAVHIEDEPKPALSNISPKETTIRLVIDNTGRDATLAVANAYQAEIVDDAPAPPNTLHGHEGLDIEPRLPPVPEWNYSAPTPLMRRATTASTFGQSPQSHIASTRADYFQQVAFAQTNEERVDGPADDAADPIQPDSVINDGQLIGPNGQLESACADPCCPPPRPLICVAGVEATFLWPDLNREAGTSFTFEDGEQESQYWTSEFTEGIDSMYLSPRIWVGVQGCKWGANVRYWHLRACEGTFDPATDEINGWDYDEWDWDKSPDVGYFTDNCLDAYTIDLELTRRFCLNDCAMQAALGVRHGSIENDESAVGTVLGDESRFMAYGHSNRFSRGTGVMLGLYGRKPLFPSSCIHWFYNARWSALWGKTGTSAETFAAVTIDGGNAGSVNGASTCVNDTLIIGEIQLGLEWNYALQCLPANAFIRTALEYQRWDGGKGYSEAGSFARYSNDDDIESTARTFASAAAPQMDLVGITVGTGLTW